MICIRPVRRARQAVKPTCFSSRGDLQRGTYTELAIVRAKLLHEKTIRHERVRNFGSQLEPFGRACSEFAPVR